MTANVSSMYSFSSELGERLCCSMLYAYILANLCQQDNRRMPARPCSPDACPFNEWYLDECPLDRCLLDAVCAWRIDATHVVR